MTPYKEFTCRHIEAISALKTIFGALLITLVISSLLFWFSPLVCLTFEGTSLVLFLLSPLITKWKGTKRYPRREFADLIRRSGTSVRYIFVVDSPAINGRVRGCGMFSAIILTKPAIRLPTEQLKALVAHELGHIKNQDVLFGSLLGLVTVSLGSEAAVWLTQYFHGGFGLLILLATIASIVEALFGTWFLRQAETRADQVAYKLVGKDLATVFTTMLASFRDELRWQISDHPHPIVRLFDVHPPFSERIQKAS